jgi:dienelactone hydrolase
LKKQHFHRGGSLIWLALAANLLTSFPAIAASFTTENVMIPFAQTGGSTVQLDTMILVPEGHQRFPLAVVSHGSPRRASDRANMSPTAFADMGKWLIDQGFAVAIPMRRGYGKSQGAWVEGFGSCQDPDYAKGGRASAQDIEAVIAYMRRQSYIDPNHVVLIGHSAGGWGSLAAASESPAGLVAAVLFAPGRGSTSPDEVCGGNALATAAGEFGKTTHVPTLWLYSENDHFFGAKVANDMYGAFHANTVGLAEFIETPSCSSDGHMMVRRCPENWQATVAAFLKKAVPER